MPSGISVCAQIENRRLELEYLIVCSIISARAALLFFRRFRDRLFVRLPCQFRPLLLLLFLQCLLALQVSVDDATYHLIDLVLECVVKHFRRRDE